MLTHFSNCINLSLVRNPPKAPSNPNPTASLTTTPYDILLQIFTYLHPAESACLGLTHRALYAIHHSLHPRIFLTSTMPSTNRPLHAMLKNWMPSDLTYEGRFTWKFVEKRRWVPHWMEFQGLETEEDACEWAEGWAYRGWDMADLDDW